MDAAYQTIPSFNTLECPTYCSRVGVYPMSACPPSPGLDHFNPPCPGLISDNKWTCGKDMTQFVPKFFTGFLVLVPCAFLVPCGLARGEQVQVQQWLL